MKDNEQDHDRIYYLHEFLIEKLCPPLLPLIFFNVIFSVAALELALLCTRTLADISLKYGVGLWNAGQNAYEYIYLRFGGDCALIYLALGTLVVPYIIINALLSILAFTKLYNLANRFLNERSVIIFAMISTVVFLFFIFQVVDPLNIARTINGSRYYVLMGLFWRGVTPIPLAGLSFLIGIFVLFGRFINIGVEPRP